MENIDVSEGIHLNKTSEPRNCDICYYWYFLNKSFKFEPNFFGRCHVLLMKFMNLGRDIAILNIKSADCCCFISGVSKNEAINVMQNVDMTEKSRVL